MLISKNTSYRTPACETLVSCLALHLRGGGRYLESSLASMALNGRLPAVPHGPLEM